MPEMYITFADPIIEQLCVEAWGDGNGMTKRRAAKMSTDEFLSVFGSTAGNDRTGVTSFDEFRYFTRVTDAGWWMNCSNLETITLPRSCYTIGVNAFHGCSSLRSINLGRIRYLRMMAFMGCSNLEIDIDMPFLSGSSGVYTYLEYQTFRESGITKILDLGTATTLGDYDFCRYCSNLTEVWLPKTLTYIGRITFLSCPNLALVVCPVDVPPRTNRNAIFDTGTSLKIYVPYSEDHSVLNAYKTADIWSNNAEQIFELNPDGTVPTT